MKGTRLLLVALDNWYGSARLPRSLRDAGFEVGLLAPSDVYAARSRDVDRRFPLLAHDSVRVQQQPAWQAIDAFAPDFIVPGDEKSVRLLNVMARSSTGSPHGRSVLRRSLPTMSSIHSRADMMALAARLGFTCPDYAVIRSLEEAARFADRNGWPVYLKRDNTAGGNGVRESRDRAGLAADFAALTNTDRSLWSAGGSLRRGRHWLRTKGLGGDPGMSVQAAVPGRPAFHTAVALDGRWLAGISAEVEEFHPRPTGPSTRVRLQRDAVMDELARKLIAALGYNGFCGLDFIRRPDGSLTFLEFNARPTPVSHLGRLVGGDLGVALHAALQGEPVPPVLPMPAIKVALFPQDWLRDPYSRARADHYLDIPTDDFVLVTALGAGLPRDWNAALTPPLSSG